MGFCSLSAGEPEINMMMMMMIFSKKITFGLSRDRVMNWSLKVHHTLKASIHYLVKCKCPETTI